MYTRKQAIEDGVLIDVSEMAREAGIRFPVAVTSTIWHKYIVPDKTLEGYGQSIEGRLWDILWMFRNTASKIDGSQLFFEVYFLTSAHKTEPIRFKAICDGGDDGAPVITIMMPDED